MSIPCHSIQSIRDTWLQFAKDLPADKFQYRFLLGARPSATSSVSTPTSSSSTSTSTFTSRRVEEKVLLEQTQFQDLLFFDDVADGYDALSEKMLHAFVWADSAPAPSPPTPGASSPSSTSSSSTSAPPPSTPSSFDYLLKTDDDCFLRLDVVLSELHEHHRRPSSDSSTAHANAVGTTTTTATTMGYWRGQVYHSMPPLTDGSKNSERSYSLPMFPPYTSGLFYVLSRDVVGLVAYGGAGHRHRLLLQNEDQALGVWLYPFDVRPVHDRRIQQWWVCENDMIAKHLARSFEEIAYQRRMDLTQMSRTFSPRSSGTAAISTGMTTKDPAPFSWQRYEQRLQPIHADHHRRQRQQHHPGPGPDNVDDNHSNYDDDADWDSDDEPVGHTAYTMRFLYQNLLAGRPLCYQMATRYCAPCYSCFSRDHHYRDWRHECDRARGITLLTEWQWWWWWWRKWS